MISSDLRTLFVDSVHTRKNNNGSYTLPLFEQIGIQPGMVAYVDDITLAGQYSAVNLTNNKLYVLEVTPGDARFTENGGAAVLATDWNDKTAGLAFLTTPAQIAGTPLEDFTYYANLPKTDQNPNGGTLFVKNDDALNPYLFVGEVFHEIINPLSVPNPLPPSDTVSGRFSYATGVCHWSSKMPYKTFEWGYAAKLPLLSIQDQTTLRILEVPVGDYTGETMREVLEATLNSGAFMGSIPEGSGQQYVVEGTGTELRVRLGDVDKPGSDRFAILPESYLTNLQNTLLYPNSWSPDRTNSLNALLGNLNGDTSFQGRSDIDFTALYQTPEPYPTPSHLTGVWEDASSTTLSIAVDVGERAYSVRSPAGVHLRSFVVAAEPDANESTTFTVTADEYMIAGKPWGTPSETFLIAAGRATNPTLRMLGYWKRYDESDNLLDTTYTVVNWDDATGKHNFDLPSTISGVVGTWTRVGVDTQTVSAGSAFREYSYTVGTEVRELLFHAWEAGYNGVHLAQIVETRPSGGGSITGATDAEGWKRDGTTNRYQATQGVDGRHYSYVNAASQTRYMYLSAWDANATPAQATMIWSHDIGRTVGVLTLNWNGTLFLDNAGSGFSLTPPAAFSFSGDSTSTEYTFNYNSGTGDFDNATAGYSWRLPTGWSLHGAYPTAATWEFAEADVDSGGGNVTMVTAHSTRTTRFSATTNSLALSTIFGEVWKPDGWLPFGRYQYTTHRYIGTLPAYPEPWYRFNTFGTVLIGDRGNAQVDPTAGKIAWDIIGVPDWETPGGLVQFTGTWTEGRPKEIDWSGDVWVNTSYDGVPLVQSLNRYRADVTPNTQRVDFYKWYQDGIEQNQQFIGVENALYIPGDIADATPALKVAEYDQSMGTLTWLPQSTNPGQVWTVFGPKRRRPAEALTWQPGQNSVLYLHFESQLQPENTRGPRPSSSTCVAKLSIDPTQMVNHLQVMRAHRHIEIPPGSMSQVTFFIRTPMGQVIDLHALGASISFVLTIAPRTGE